MKKWLTRIRGALLMGLTWALVWMPFGLLLGMILDPDGSMDEPWIAVGTFPGFLAGVVFSIVLGVAARRRKLDDLSVRKVARWGAFAGLLLSALIFVSGDQKESVKKKWLLPVVVTSAITLLSAASAAGSLALARKGAKRESLDVSADVAEVEASHRSS